MPSRSGEFSGQNKPGESSKQGQQLKDGESSKKDESSKEARKWKQAERLEQVDRAKRAQKAKDTERILQMEKAHMKRAESSSQPGTPVSPSGRKASWDEDHYQVLGVDSKATTEEIDKAYFKSEITARTLEAWQVLSDPKKRQIYDTTRQLFLSKSAASDFARFCFFELQDQEAPSKGTLPEALDGLESEGRSLASSISIHEKKIEETRAEIAKLQYEIEQLGGKDGEKSATLQSSAVKRVKEIRLTRQKFHLAVLLKEKEKKLMEYRKQVRKLAG